MSDDANKATDAKGGEDAKSSEAKGKTASSKGKSKSTSGSKSKSSSGGKSKSSSSKGKGKSKSAAGSKAKADGKAKADDQSDAASEDAARRDLPKWNRARVKRKAPAGEEQDVFQASVRKAGQGLLQRPWVVIGLIVAVAGVGAGGYAWTQHAKEQRAVATELLATAVAYEARGMVEEDLETQMAERVRPLPRPVVKDEAERAAKVDEALSNLEEAAPDSPANIVADLVRAARLARASDYAGAEKAFRGFLERQPDHELTFVARDGLIVCLEAQGKIDDALAEVEPLLGAEGDFFRDQALWHKGRLLEDSGRTDEATEIYKQYAAEYPLDKPSQARELVRDRLEKLDPSAVPPEPGIPGMPGGLQSLGGFGP